MQIYKSETHCDDNAAKNIDDIKNDSLIDAPVTMNFNLYESNSYKLKEKHIMTILIPALLIITLVVIYIYSSIVPSRKYQSALVMLQNNQYDEAITAFTELNKYMDSEELVKESKYYKALDLIKDGDKASALLYLKAVGDFKNAKQYIYDYATELMNAGDYETAITVFRDLNGYSDSDDMVNEMRYNTAINHMKNKEYDKAKKIFKRLGDYKDSSQYKNEIETILEDE